MDTGLRKLWTRQRGKIKSSRGARDTSSLFKETPTYEGHISGPAPQLGTLPFKPSQSRPSTKTSGHTKAKSEGWQEFTRVGETAVYAQPKSSGGIQPVLVGISRPATASSLANAVSQAADEVAQGRSPGRSPTAKPFPTIAPAPAPARGPQARYVDIFQITAQEKAQANKYNEDIAARNLDLRLVALSSRANGYDANSKYQEEVAVRNASIELPRQSLSSVRSVEGNQSSTESKHGSRLIGSDDVSSYKHDPATPHGKSRTGQLLEQQSVQQPRMYSMTAKTRASQLPAIPQESQHEGGEVPEDLVERTPEISHRSQRDQGAKTGQAVARSRLHPQANNGPEASSSKLSPHGSGSRSLTDDSARDYSNTSPTSQHSVASIPNYKVSPGELGQIWPGFAPNSLVHPPVQDEPQSNETLPVAEVSTGLLRPPSSHNKPPSLKKAVNLSNRTIMDLTGNDSDIFAEAEPAESYTESPVLQQARFSPMYPVQPSIVDNPPEQHRGIMAPPGLDRREGLPETRYFDLAGVETPKRARVVEEAIRENERAGDSFSDPGSVNSRASAPRISFSKISTLASMSPKSSAITLNASSSTAGQSNTDGIEGILQSLSQLPETVEEAPNLESEPLSPRSARTSISSPISNSGPVSGLREKNKLPPLAEDVLEQTPPSTANKRQTEHLTTPILQFPPESPTRNGFTNSSTAFGVHARDFANESSSSAPQQSNGLSSRKSPRGQAENHVDFASKDVSTSTGTDRKHKSSRSMKRRNEIPTPEYTSTFDEEDFARKQVEAKAALQRLKISLQEGDFQDENYIASAGPSRYLAAPAPAVRARPHVPTSIYTSHKRPGTWRTAIESSESPNLPQSVHAMVTVPSPASSNPSSPWPEARILNDRVRYATNSVGSASGYGNRLTPIRQNFDHPIFDQALTPVSPSEISLSSFPLPSGSPVHSRQTSIHRPLTARRNSQKSMSSAASAFSIPYHMVPGRSSSMRNCDDGFSLYER